MLRFHAMKHFISCHETVCFKRRNTLFHPVKRTDTSRACFRPSAKDFALLVNECKRLRVYTIVDFSFIRTFAP